MNTAKEKIEKEFRRLLECDGFDKITVTDICRAAQINRTTFYEYYHSKGDVLCALQTEYFDKMYDAFAEEYKNTEKSGKRSFFLKILHYHKEHYSELIYLFKNNSEGILETNLCVHLKQKILGKNYGKRAEFEFIYHFIGHLTVVASWILEGMTLSEEELADIMTDSTPSKDRV